MNSKIFKIITWGLILVSVALTLWGYISGFQDDALNSLLIWTYAMVGIGIAAVAIVGTIISAINNPKSLFKLALIICAVAVIVAVAYVLAPGTTPIGWIGGELSETTLKLTDTVLNLTYFICGCALLAFIVGPVVNFIRSK